MSITTRFLGGSAAHVSVGCVGLGLMRFTWTDKEILPDDEVFSTLKTAADHGVTYWNSASFYGHADPLSNIKLLGRFFAKYPEYADKITIGVKGGFYKINNLARTDCSEQNLRYELGEIQKCLGPYKKIDIYGPARRDMTRSQEETMKTLCKLQKEGLFSHIGLSEVNGATIRASHAVGPIATVEVEYNPFTLDIEHNDVMAACQELDIAIIAYSPLGWGFFTGATKGTAGETLQRSRGMFERFQGDNYQKNAALADRVSALASRHGYEPAEFVLAWEMQQYSKLIPIPGTTKTANLLNNIRSAQATLSAELNAEFRRMADELHAQVSGGRYNELLRHSLAR
ncbi:pyridoxine 4-dehydrogenase [Malassezia nana]|uniref:Pyridoxine 4-dehydrogenase n=1 Tax=Malassezia nana TaxID=180528 RepID=A0AAF0EH28_9BASI|nr:pyridoxine 4-dehydrogenase [Malassezia nana]